MDHFWPFLLTFIHSKCKGSWLRSQSWMRLFLLFSNTVKVPKTHCVDTLRPVHHTECHEVAVPSCHQVPRKVPVETPHQKCVSVPHEHCQDYPEKVARKVCHTPPPKLPKKRYGWWFLANFWKIKISLCSSHHSVTPWHPNGCPNKF